MRVSTLNLFDASIANLQKRQENMQAAQERLTSGKRVLLASDDPTGAARAERALAAIGRVDANQRALEASRNGMTLSEAAIGDATELLQQARETMLSAGNFSYTDAERQGLANKLKGLRSQLLGIANRPDGSGGYLFSGQGSASPPFVDQAGGVRFNGTPGNVQTGNVDNFPLTVDGRRTWEQARTGNGSFLTEPLTNLNSGKSPGAWIDSGRVTDATKLSGHEYTISITGDDPSATYTVTDVTLGSEVATGPYLNGGAVAFDGIAVSLSGKVVDGDQYSIKPSSSDLKVFDVLDRAIAELNTATRTNVEIAQSNSGRLRDFDGLISNMQNVRSQVGEQLNNLDGTEGRMAALKEYNQSERSSAEDLDMIAGISDFQNQQSGYDAALKTYATVQRMSLFDYIR